MPKKMKLSKATKESPGPLYRKIKPYKKPKTRYKPASERKYSLKAEKKIHKVIQEFEEGKLHSGKKTGPVVKHLRQALAIAISEAKREGLKAGEKWKKAERKPRPKKK